MAACQSVPLRNYTMQQIQCKWFVGGGKTARPSWSGEHNGEIETGRQGDRETQEGGQRERKGRERQRERERKRERESERESEREREREREREIDM